VKKLLSFIIILSAITAIHSKETADFIILDQPSKFTILNQYQQPASESDLASLIPNAPLKVVASDETLGDQITRVLLAEYNGKTFYLQKDEKGVFLGKGAFQTLKNCELIDDTVTVVAEKTIAFSSQKTHSSANGYVVKGEIVVRLFRNNDLFFVKRSSPSVRYGWTFGPQAAWKKVVVVASVDTGMATLVLEKVLDRFKKANQSYSVYFEHFNQVTGSQRSVPAWKWEKQGETIHCFLNAPYKSTLMLEESTQYLVRDIENLLIGRQYEVIADRGDVLVRKKSAGVQ
jgi:hypothetical protein